MPQAIAQEVEADLEIFPGEPLRGGIQRHTVRVIQPFMRILPVENALRDERGTGRAVGESPLRKTRRGVDVVYAAPRRAGVRQKVREIGRASCRERGE